MATAGRKPDPAPLRLLKNDKAHAHRHAGKVEPIPSSQPAVAPDTLSARGKEIFNHILSLIQEMYEVSATDTDLLVLYANNREMLEYLENLLRVEGVTYRCQTRNGEEMIKARPEVAMLNHCKSLELKLLPEFGLSPSGRARMNLKPKEAPKENKFAALG